MPALVPAFLSKSKRFDLLPGSFETFVNETSLGAPTFLSASSGVDRDLADKNVGAPARTATPCRLEVSLERACPHPHAPVRQEPRG